MDPKRYISGFLSLTLKGVILTVPMVVTIYALVSVVQFLDGLIPIESDVPGAGIAVACLLLALMGYLGSTYIAKPIIKAFQVFIDKAPFIKTVYSTIKDVINALIGKKKAFNRPVRVKLFAGGTMEKIGFLTEEDLTNLGITNDLVAVYFPHSYNFSGNLFLVKRENITPIDAPSSDVMKFVVSAGISGFEKKQDEGII
ncbi:MAG: putative membrane protein [Sphingobacteriales bacterium]|jgi:uncharacterized membrane protein